MTTENSQADANGDPAKQSKSRPQRALPTDRVAFEKQLAILRAYAAASGPEKRAVSNEEVGAIVPIHKNTVSICNPFFVDAGLLVREGMKLKPTDDTFNYFAAHEWDAERAPSKLAPAMRATWFATSLIPKLSFRQLTRDEALSFLAEEARAPKEYKSQLELLIDYLRVAQIVTYDGATVALGPLARETGGAPATPPGSGTTPPLPITPPPGGGDVERFSVPIPGKESVTITFPKDLDREDWEMAKQFVEAYVSRLKKWPTKNGPAA